MSAAVPWPPVAPLPPQPPRRRPDAAAEPIGGAADPAAAIRDRLGWLASDLRGLAGRYRGEGAVLAYVGHCGALVAEIAELIDRL